MENSLLEKRRHRERNEHEWERERERERRQRWRRRRRRSEREKSSDSDREKEQENEKVKKRRREREKRDGREREWEREREKRSEYDSDGGRDERQRHRKRRRRERDDDYTARGGKSTREESPARKKSGGGDMLEKKEKKSRQEEMERRRKRRKTEESEREKRGEGNVEEAAAKVGKAWTLEGDDDGKVFPTKLEANMDVDENENSKLGGKEIGELLTEDGDSDHGKDKLLVTENGNTAAVAEEDDEIDPLDAFMNSVVLPEVEKLSNSVVDHSPTYDDKNGDLNKGSKKAIGRIIPGEGSDSDYEYDEESVEDEDDDEFMKRVKMTKAEKLSIVDHSKIDYKPFRKNSYIEVKDIARMTPEEVSVYRKELELKLQGKNVPKPVKTWPQTGLTTKILSTLMKLNYERPMPIQAQALPIIMSGRDCIGIANTGSGKTLAFVLPMLRHIKYQPPVVAGDGPIGLIMAPTRELVHQIHNDIKKFAKALGIRCVPVYGGSGVAQQINQLKRGAEIVVCTPGRMIDILCTSGGKITNLRSVTYLVLDEADRMFDMGFEPQITRIIHNIRPDRQTVLFSATFPRKVEILARKVLNKPVEIQVGGRSVVNKDIIQLVEVRPGNERFLRLLELLGEWYEKGKILIFVHTQEKCDTLFKDLLKHGYLSLSLHGAKDQTDRECTISDFKSNACNLLVATSVAARGLDVKELDLVINFDAPNHYEDYVHRVGRTGRAGRKGCAITFISEDDARYAPDLAKALELSEQVVPADLKALADGFMTKVNQGFEQAHGTGYGGSGFKFNEDEDEKRKAAKKAQAKEYGFEEDKSDSEDEEEMAAPKPVIPAALNLKHILAKVQTDAMCEHYEAELQINELPQKARWKVTNKETLGPISECTGAAITTRGQYFPPGRTPGYGERKLYLFIEGPSEISVKRAKEELKRVMEDFSQQALQLIGGTRPGRYQIL